MKEGTGRSSENMEDLSGLHREGPWAPVETFWIRSWISQECEETMRRDLRDSVGFCWVPTSTEPEPGEFPSCNLLHQFDMVSAQLGLDFD